MPIAPGMRPTLINARERLAEGRAKLKEFHAAGASGVQVCAHMADLMDTILLDIIREAYDEATEGNRDILQGRVALIPHGGYGRRDVAPYSDADLMLLYRPDSYSYAESISKRLNHDIVDIGLSLGFSARTPRDACNQASSEPEIFTSLCESRYLSGSVSLYKKFMSRLVKQSNRNTRLVQGVREKRLEERLKFGETAYLLRPNVKKSAGALRDIQLIRWLGFIQYGQTDLSGIHRQGGLHDTDHLNLVSAREYFLRLRNELHFHAGKSQDQLGKNEQLRIAEILGYESRDGHLPVEIFMQDYFNHSSQVSYSAEHWLASVSSSRSTVTRVFLPLVSRKLDGMFRVGPREIAVEKNEMQRVRSSLEDVLHLMSLANSLNKFIEHDTWHEIRESMREAEQVEISPIAAEHFVSFLAEQNRLADLIRRMHELSVLEKLIPGFRKARCLIQFNQYHKYTVDEHTIRALQIATGYAESDTALGRAYRSISRKNLIRLHLAILLHDLGKALPGDHSESGGELAEETCALLGLTDRDAKAVRFLVENHLKMAHLAFRRDISDESVIANFAAEVGRPDYLQMLFVLTCADVSAVGPGVMTDWKMSILNELYLRTMLQLSDESVAEKDMPDVDPIRDEIRRLVSDFPDADWFNDQINAVKPHFATNIDPGDVVEMFRELKTLPRGELKVMQRYLAAHKACEILIGKHNEDTFDVFYKLTGAISGAGLNIISTTICYLDAPLVLYRFLVTDGDFAGEPPKHRSDQIRARIEKSLSDEAPEPVFRRTFGAREISRADEITRRPPIVRFDNETSQTNTIIDIFAHDWTGLLYTITRKLFDLNLHVYFAKIGTIVDQVVDVFYVTDEHGQKIVDQGHLEYIRQELLAAVVEPVQETAE